MSYANEYSSSIDTPARFWGDKASALPWFVKPTTILSKDENNMDRWFADGVLNTCYMAVDHHVQSGRGDQAAIIYDSPVTNTKSQLTYSQLQTQVAAFAGALRDKGVGKGDRVIIYMPMIPEAAIAMLAVARLGAIHSVVFGGFAPAELAVRIDDATPKVIVTASCGVEIAKVIPYKPLVDEAINLATHSPDSVIMFQRDTLPAQLHHERDCDWNAVISAATPAEPVPVNGTDPLYILYTSGTTGAPKGVMRDNGGHAVAMHYSMAAIYDNQPGDVFWAASDVGWVVGHSYIVYAPLLAGCTTIMYEGKPVRTPDAGGFWRMVEEYQVKTLFAAPTAFRAIKKEDPDGLLINDYDISCLNNIFMAGERLDPPTYDWTVEKTGKPVIDHWWQTETGWAICGNMLGIEKVPVKPGSATLPISGFNVCILDESGAELPAGSQGAIAIKCPLPPSCLPSIWGNFERFESAYLTEFPGYYSTGDGGYIDEDGYVFIMGRTDDVINIAGHRLSTGEMEEVVAQHPAVAECAVIGVKDSLKGQLPVGMVILKDGQDITDADLHQDIKKALVANIGPIACFKDTLIVPRLPKTRSGKILRKILRNMADGQAYTVPSTIDDPACLDEMHGLMQSRNWI